MKLRINKYRTLFLILWINIFGDTNFISCKDINNLKNITYYQGLISDKIILNFENLPTCFCEPTTDFNKLNHIKNNTNNNKQFVMFFPLAKAIKQNTSRIIQTINKAQTAYKIALEESNKKSSVLRLNIHFNPNVIGFEYGHSRIGNNSYILIFNHKKNINSIDNQNTPVRWYVNVNKQPRIYITYDNNKYLFRCADQIANLLKLRGTATTIKPLNKEYSGHVGFVNCVLRPDFYLTITSDKSLKPDEPVRLLISKDSIFLTRKKNIIRQNIDQNYEANILKLKSFHEEKSNQLSKLIAQNFNQDLNMLVYAPIACKSHDPMFGIEMPSITIAINEENLKKNDYIKKLSYACAKSILETFNAK